MMNPDLKRNNLKAFAFLASPLILAGSSIYLFMLNSLIWYWLGTLLLSVFFAQTFILLHECGHLSYFENRIINKFFGHIFGLLTVIPFYNWQQIHNLHHKWTGWRDLDPTTEKTAKPVNSKITR